VETGRIEEEEETEMTFPGEEETTSGVTERKTATEIGVIPPEVIA
jgi:hypothetical protein